MKIVWHKIFKEKGAVEKKIQTMGSGLCIFLRMVRLVYNFGFTIKSNRKLGNKVNDPQIPP